MRACAERVAPQLGVLAWVVDDTGIAKDGQALAGGEAAVLGHAGQDRQLPDRGVSVHAVGRARDAAARLAAVSARGVVRGRRAAAQGEDPRRASPSQTEAAAGRRAVRAGRRLGDAGARRSWPTGLRRRRRLPRPAARARGSSTWSRSRAQTSVFAPETTLRGARARAAARGRPPSVARPDRRPESVRALAAAAAARRLDDARLPHHAATARTSTAASRSCASSPRTRSRATAAPPRAEWLIIEWPADAEAPSDYWLSQPARRTPAASGSPGSPGCAGRSSSTTASSKASSDSTTTKAAATVGFHHHCALVTCAHAFLTRGTARPKSPAAGLTLPAGGAAPAARPALLGRPLPNLPTTRRPRPTRPLPPPRMSNKVLLIWRSCCQGSRLNRPLAESGGWVGLVWWAPGAATTSRVSLTMRELATHCPACGGRACAV